MAYTTQLIHVLTVLGDGKDGRSGHLIYNDIFHNYSIRIVYLELERAVLVHRWDCEPRDSPDWGGRNLSQSHRGPLFRFPLKLYHDGHHPSCSILPQVSITSNMSPTATFPSNGQGVSNGHSNAAHARKQARTNSGPSEKISSAALIQMEYDYSAHK